MPFYNYHSIIDIFSTYCYLIKLNSKQKHLLETSEMTNKKIYIDKCIINVDSNGELKVIDIKDHTCHYFDDIIKTEDFHDFLIDQ